MGDSSVLGPLAEAESLQTLEQVIIPAFTRAGQPGAGKTQIMTWSASSSGRCGSCRTPSGITGRSRLQWADPALQGQFDYTGPTAWPGLAHTAMPPARTPQLPAPHGRY